MNKGGKIAIGLVGLAGLGIAGYFLWKYLNKDKNPDFTFEPNQSVTPQTASTPSGGGYTGGGTTKPANIDTLSFQKYVITVKNDKTILGSGGASGFGDDGVWGSKSQTAWVKYGADYVASLSPIGPETTTGTASTAIDQAKANFSDAWYDQQGDKIFNAMSGLGTDESTIRYVFAKLKSNKDYWNLKEAFGKRENWDMKRWLTDEMFQYELDRFVNKPMKENGLTVWVS